MAACLYVGTVTHQRPAAPRYRFRYRLFHLAVDIDRIEQDLRHLQLLSHNRFNLFSLHDADHGPRDGSPLRPWIDAVLGDCGIDLQGGRVRLLCMPRMLGLGFNPLSLWYCHHADGSLRAVLCEVRNTFGENHGYLLHDGGAAMCSPVRSTAAKCFHVSPFLPLRGSYGFRLALPGARLALAIRYVVDGRTVLEAAQYARRLPLLDRHLSWLALTRPLQPLKVIAAIHWQALKLWLRGARVHRKPDPQRPRITH